MSKEQSLRNEVDNYESIEIYNLVGNNIITIFYCDFDCNKLPFSYGYNQIAVI